MKFHDKIIVIGNKTTKRLDKFTILFDIDINPHCNMISRNNSKLANTMPSKHNKVTDTFSSKYTNNISMESSKQCVICLDNDTLYTYLLL